MEPLLQNSQEIINRAIAEHQPYAHVLMFSGGGDSMTALEVCRALNVRIDYVMHIRTGTGIPETTEFVRKFCEEQGLPYIEADSGLAYENYVLRKGFFGVGVGKMSAHSFAFHTVKRTAYERAIAKHIRQGKRGRKILLLNGARIAESDNRAKNFADQEIRFEERKKSDIWVNPVHYWEKSDCRAFCSERKCPKNPVSEVLCRSGECLCGSAQGKETRAEAAYWFPHWGKWLDELERQVKERGFPWGWGEPIPRSWYLEKMGQLKLIPDELLEIANQEFVYLPELYELAKRRTQEDKRVTQKDLESMGQLNLFEPMCTSCVAKAEVEAK